VPADLAAVFDAAREAGLLANLHAVVLRRGGETLFERYWTGTDSSLARPRGIVRFQPDTLHDLRSVTKSIVGLLYGIALERRLVPGPEAVLLDHFPEYPDLAAEAPRRARTISHVLTMTLGMEWDELSIPYTDPRNSEIAMEAAADRYRFILDRPITGEPGRRWVYCGGATALLARLIEKGSGARVEDFAREALFAPLGITAWEWMCGRDGATMAASGLRLAPRDLATIGEVLLAGGRGIVPASWIDASFVREIAMPDGRYYGRHWYLGAVPRDDGAPGVRWEPTVSAIGNGGQRLTLLPEAGIVAVVTAGNYDTPDQWLLPTRVLRDLLLPALDAT
jgi:CubicO group peptidase (beta-lactamase class C family)